MKTELIKKDETKKFEPFVLKIKVESVEEARTMYHVFNRCDLPEMMLESKWYGEFSKLLKHDSAYTNDLANLDENLGGIIKREIESQGFKV